MPTARHYITLLLCLLTGTCMAQEMSDNQDKSGPAIDQLYVETRIGWEGFNVDGAGDHDNTGFKGQYLNLRFDGQLTKGLTFSYRQRLSKKTEQTFWDATDWLHLDWQINRHWALSGGKQVVAVGGYEYDRAPIDLYYTSEFWYNIACYQLGASVSYAPSCKDKILFQFCNSPFRSVAGNNTYGMGLVWTASHGWWQPIWSVNAFEHHRGQWMNWIALGNRFLMGKYVMLDLDWTNRYAGRGQQFFSDYTIATELSVRPCASTRAYLKYTFDHNKAGNDFDQCLADGTQLHMVTAGCEVSPLRHYREHLRLFAAAAYNWGENGSLSGTKRDREFCFMAGAKIRLDILGGIKSIMNKRK